MRGAEPASSFVQPEPSEEERDGAGSRNLDVSTLVLMGLWTNFVVEATARHASDIGYRVIVARECCASNSDDNHAFAINQILPGVATVAGLEEVLGALG